MENIEKELLNHKCINCKFINTKDFKSCYCELTARRIQFNKNVFDFCPLLDIAMRELNAPCLDEKCYALLNDETVVQVGGENCAYYNYDLNEYEYYCNVYDGGWTYKSHDKIKHSDIKKIFNNRSEASKYIKENKLSCINNYYCDFKQ